MSDLKFLRNTQIIILGLCIAAATIVSTAILSRGLLQMKKFTSEVISVTGSAEKKIVSDYIVWKSEFSRRAAEMTVAYESLSEDLKNIKDYLLSKGIRDDEIIVSQIKTRTLYRKNEKGHNTNEIEAYALSQNIEVRSYDVEKVSKISRESTELIMQDIQFISSAPQYFYTKLAELKIEMLAIASEDAKERADKMAASTGSSIGVMRKARMGIFQITPVNSYDVSWYGKNDTTSYDKKVMAVVNVDFAISD